MPLSLRSPWQLLGRVRRGSRDEGANHNGSAERAKSTDSTNGASTAATGSASSRPNKSAPAAGQTSRSTGKKTSTSSASGVEPVATASGNKAFRVQVPVGARPGDSIRFRAPDGRLVEIDLPPDCVPGQKVTIEIDSRGDWRGTLKALTASVKTSFEATQASCTSLTERLKEELELQRGLWASASQTTQSDLFNMRQGNRAQDLTLAMSGGGFNEELSQTQALVFACAEAGDGKQLLAALAEARTFSPVCLSFEECVHNLNAAEEAMVTWRCLLDALQAENRHEIEVWVEEAASLGLERPAGLPDVLNELKRREEESLKLFAKAKEAEDKLKFAFEADDPDLLAEVVAEAESMGVRGHMMQQAAARVRSQQQERFSRAMGGAEAGAGPPQTETKSRLGDKPVPKTDPSPLGGGMYPGWNPAPRSPPAGSPAPPQRAAASQANRRDEPIGSFNAPSDEPSARSPGQSQFSRGGMGGATASSSYPGGAEAGAGPSPNSPPTAIPSMPSSGPSARPQASYSQPAQIPGDGKTIRELMEECRRLGIDTTRCTDADDLRRLLLNRPQQPREQPKAPAPQGFVKQVPANQARSQDGNTVWGRQSPPPQHITKRSKSLYLLGLDPYRTPAPAELRSAYRKVAMECHPDRAQNHSRQDAAKDLFQKVKEAFDFLSSQ